MSTLIERTSNKLVKAFLRNKTIAPLPRKFTKKLTEANKFRMLCESKVKKPIIGFKAGGTGIPVMKKLKEKEPFYASVYKNNFLKSGGFLLYSSAFFISLTAPIHRLISLAIPSTSRPAANADLIVLNAAVAVATAVIGSIMYCHSHSRTIRI